VKFEIRVTGGPAARDKLAALSAKLANKPPWLLRAGIVVLTAAQGHIRDQDGGSWPPAAMDYGSGSLLYRTGALFRSLTIGAEGNVTQQIPDGIQVGTNLKTPDGYSLGRLMQFGTGPIKPKNAKMLAFSVNGQMIFSRGTKGIPGRRFLYIDPSTAERAVAAVASEIQGIQ
jgi:hypothetical protein